MFGADPAVDAGYPGFVGEKEQPEGQCACLSPVQKRDEFTKLSELLAPSERVFLRILP
jgi:hypothetical protein